MAALADMVNAIDVSPPVPTTSGPSAISMASTMAAAAAAAVPAKPEVLPVGSWAEKAVEQAADPGVLAAKPSNRQTVTHRRLAYIRRQKR